MNRRTFMKYVGAVLGILALRGATTALAEDEDWTAVGSESDFPLDTPVFLKDYLAYVTRRADGVLALSARCTHRGCTVQWSEDKFICPCHQAQFSSDGKVLKAPASEPLEKIVSKVDSGQVWLSL